jgi:imidazolonepropionase-like amidohydrolase
MGQQITKSTYEDIALVNATIETVTSGIVQGTVLIQKGKITGIGNVTLPSGIKQIDCSGLTVYPGMIDAGTRIGLSEVGSISLTNDYSELGSIRPQMNALTAINPNAAHIPVTRVNGITTALAVPAGGRFSGTAALVNLVGYTPDQMYAGFSAVVMNYPGSSRRSRFDRRSDEDLKKEEEKALKEITELWEKLDVYHKMAKASKNGNGKNPDYNPALETLLPVYNGEAPLLIEVNKAKDIKSALKWTQEKKVKAIFTGCAEGWSVANELAEAKIPVITGPVLATPTRSSDRYDKAYANAGLMHKAGVKVAIRTNEAENIRNLPYNAGFAATYGMGKEAALKAVTIVPAEIFGLGDQMGSIEKGKVANLFVADGDPFETKTSIKHLFINGWNIPLESRHTYLYDEFLDRSPGLDK